MRPWLRMGAAAALVLAGCGGGPARDAAPTPAPTTASAPIAEAAPSSCLGVTTDLVMRVSGVGSVRGRPLQAAPGMHQRCGVVFFDGAGGLVVQVRAVSGGVADLRQAARLAAVSAGGPRPERVRPVPA